MEIIAELEGEGRGAYTGSLGFLGRDGRMDFNILIRTMTLRGRRIELRAGAGIVADSIPERELEETRAKARGLLRRVRCTAPDDDRRDRHVVLVDGESRIAAWPRIDRGLHYGDGLFETIVCASGPRCAFGRLHLDRLTRGCARLPFASSRPGGDRTEIAGARADAQRAAIIKIIVTRGERASRAAMRRPARNGTAHRAALSVAAAGAGQSLARRALGIAALRLGENRSSPGSSISTGSSRFWRKPRCALRRMSKLLLFSSSRRRRFGHHEQCVHRPGRGAPTPRARAMRRRGCHARAWCCARRRRIGMASEECDLGAADLERTREIFLTNARIGIWPCSES